MDFVKTFLSSLDASYWQSSEQCINHLNTNPVLNKYLTSTIECNYLHSWILFKFSTNLNTEPDVTIMVSDSDESLEPSPLTGTSLLLDGHDLQHLVLKGRAQEEVDDLKLLDGQGEEVDFFL